ncbi:hypothetical protein ABIA24_001968 [Sinorhizobium fredii]|uniref:hypothetical protein n=2 Tax=Rhizobium fredii TaxID=380 RepID=UPI003517E120
MENTMFIETNDGDFINVAHIVSFRHGSRPMGEHHNSKFTTVKTAPGDFHKVYGHLDADDFAPVIPSAPGFTILEFWADGMECGVHKSPVLAWRISQICLPMTCDDINENESAVLCPDGAVIEPGIARYESLDEWFNEKRETWFKRHKQQA